MITRVQVKNFRSLVDVDVELGPLTVLVGRNGAGKSTFLDVLRFVRDALRLGLDTAISQRGGIGAIRRWSAQGKPYDIQIRVNVSTPNIWGEYSFIIGSERQEDYKVKREVCSASVSQITGDDGKPLPETFEVQGGEWKTPPSGFFAYMNGVNGRPLPTVSVSQLVLPTMATVSPVMSQLQGLLLRTSFFAIFPNLLREPQKPTSEKALLDNAENLAVALQRLKNSLRFRELVSVLDRVTDGIENVRVRQVGGYLVTELKHNAKNGHSPWFELAQASDGTIRVLGLLAALYQDVPRTLLAIEEPELAIHPGALALLSDVVQEAATRNQVITTTQSPDLISRFKAEQLRIVERIDGQTYIGPIDEVQRETINDQLFSAGDLLRIEGLHRKLPEETAASHA